MEKIKNEDGQFPWSGLEEKVSDGLDTLVDQSVRIADDDDAVRDMEWKCVVKFVTSWTKKELMNTISGDYFRKDG